MKKVRFSFLALIFFTLNACERSLETSGIYLNQAEIDQVTLGMSGAQVQQLFGSPSYISAVDENFWAYIGTKLQVRLFQNPKPVERRILALHISGGKVQDIIVLDLKNAQKIFPNPERTPSSGRTISLLEELLGNVKRFED